MGLNGIASKCGERNREKEREREKENRLKEEHKIVAQNSYRSLKPIHLIVSQLLSYSFINKQHNTTQPHLCV